LPIRCILLMLLSDPDERPAHPPANSIRLSYHKSYISGQNSFAHPSGGLLVYWGGERIEGGDVVVINPRTVQKAWMQGRDVEQWIPDHEVDNILSYQSYGDPANNPMVSTEDVLTGIGHLMAPGTSGHWVLTKQVMTTNGYEESSDFGVEVGASIGYEGGMSFFGVGFKYGFEVSVEGTYDKNELNTYSTTVANKDSIHVQYNSIVPSFYNATYNLTPYAYWSKKRRAGSRLLC